MFVYISYFFPTTPTKWGKINKKNIFLIRLKGNSNFGEDMFIQSFLSFCSGPFRENAVFLQFRCRVFFKQEGISCLMFVWKSYFFPCNTNRVGNRNKKYFSDCDWGKIQILVKICLFRASPHSSGRVPQGPHPGHQAGARRRVHQLRRRVPEDQGHDAGWKNILFVCLHW